ncbi:MAG TPA: patatin-like phospholipase family protein [Anaerolineae bacterium]|nr:patatin-like phospholipase family protein [Anaerolineae bacterium]
MSPKIGLALGGGGARGLAHIGVLKVLQREQIPIDVISGTSMGGIVGGMYAAGLSIEQMEAEALKRGHIAQIFKLIDVHLIGGGLLSGKRIKKLLARLLGEETTFASLRVPFAVVSTDYNSGREVVLKEGNVAEAVRATMSVPGVFDPVEIGGYKLLDGGVLDNVPAGVARDLGAEKVIAVDVLPNFRLNEPGQDPIVPPLKPKGMPKSYRQLWHVELVMIAALTEFRLKQARPDVIIRPDLPVDMDLLMSFDRPQEAIECGERAAEAALPQIRALL